MRIKSTFVLILLMLALLPSTGPAITIDDSHELIPPAPVFRLLNDTGDPSGSQIYQNNTAVTIRYSADRFDVEGVSLFGFGSNLTDNDQNMEYVRNFTRVSSLKANSFYEIELTITGYTYFYAYAWYGDFSNGTYEQLDLFGDAPGHQLWIEEEKLYPDYDQAGTDGEIRNGELYVPQYTNITLQYQVQDNEDVDEFVTLSVAENETAVFSESTSLYWVNMTRVNYTDGFSIYQQEINVTLPILYFSAFNDRGWERASATTSSVHKIETGFNFTTDFSKNLADYTNLDQISFNITSFNATEQSSAGYQYQVFENNTATDEPIQNWTIGDPLTPLVSEYVNDSFAGETSINATLKQIYNVTIDQFFEIGNVIELKTFIEYGQGTMIESELFRIEILDPAPDITISTKNNTIVRFNTSVIKFSYSTPIGDIDSAVIEQSHNGELLETYDIFGGDINATIDFRDINGVALEGNHSLLFNITNSLGVSAIESFIYFVDQTAPNGTIAITIPNSGSSLDGKVRVSITYEDLGIAPSGIKLVAIDWGNNMTVNATNLSSVSMQYRQNGQYDIVMTVYDAAGNSIEVSTVVNIAIPSNQQNSNNGNSPIPFLPVLASLFIALPVIIKKRR